MLEIIIMIFVVRAFRRTAEEKGLSKVQWSLIGAGSFYGPVILLGWVIMPLVLEDSNMDMLEALLVSFVVNVAVGAACCALAYRYLKGLPSEAAESKDTPSDPTLLDQNLD